MHEHAEKQERARLGISIRKEATCTSGKEITMPVNRINKIVAALLMIAARLVSVSYANHPTAGDHAITDPGRSQTYLPLPPGR